MAAGTYKPAGAGGGRGTSFSLLKGVASPCIDAGDSASDYSLEPEPDGGRINMGTYGNTSEAESRSWLYITSYNPVRTTRVGRTLFEYEFTLTVRNADNQAALNIAMQLLSVPSNVQIIDAIVNVGTLPAGATVTTQDTFTIRVDRTTLVSALPISWRAISSGTGPLTFMGVLNLDPGSSAGDFDEDGDVDAEDLVIFRACATGAGFPYDVAALPAGCSALVEAGFLAADFDMDGDVDMDDFGHLQRCMNGSGRPGACQGP